MTITRSSMKNISSKLKAGQVVFLFEEESHAVLKFLNENEAILKRDHDKIFPIQIGGNDVTIMALQQGNEITEEDFENFKYTREW